MSAKRAKKERKQREPQRFTVTLTFTDDGTVEQVLLNGAPTNIGFVFASVGDINATVAIPPSALYGTMALSARVLDVSSALDTHKVQLLVEEVLAQRQAATEEAADVRDVPAS